MKITLDLSKAELEILANALYAYRRDQRSKQSEMGKDPGGIFAKRINTAFALESAFGDAAERSED